MSLWITNVQDFTLHDGPGIRTTVFLAGCPLSCAWCHNPEAQSLEKRLSFDEKKCISCKLCASCEKGVHQFEGNAHLMKRSNCSLCGNCVSLCPTGALEFTVKELSDGEFLRLAQRQLRLSGSEGGLTFSGGEPLMQGRELLRLIGSVRVHTAIETCGYADGALFEEVVGAVDYVMFDLKLAKEEEHIRYTGVSNEVILQNLQRLRASGKPYLLRTPLIPKITDTEENLRALEKIVGSDPWEKLEYNPLSKAKYERLGIEYPYEKALSDKEN